ncbi:MAG: hypothetical protein IPO88_08815 [Nannocystis sp.]|uniref:hypothetical protein n=1 Tax=Nannocystis sp. TaxID=1962667 RepID=UPI00242854E8|nr:hypothetical protein [Nannocystis sp.]MBK9753594.1 hypothetical protein [Nannocystis sp.]
MANLAESVVSASPPAPPAIATPATPAIALLPPVAPAAPPGPSATLRPEPSPPAPLRLQAREVTPPRRALQFEALAQPAVTSPEGHVTSDMSVATATPAVPISGAQAPATPAEPSPRREAPASLPAAIDRHQFEDVLVEVLRAAARRHGVEV